MIDVAPVMTHIKPISILLHTLYTHEKLTTIYYIMFIIKKHILIKQARIELL